MRTLLLMLFLPLISLGQASQNDSPGGDQVIQDSFPGTSIFLKDGNVLFKKVYTSDLKKADLSDQIYTLLSVMKNFKLNSELYLSSGQITGKFFRYNINRDKYRISRMNATASLYDPINAMVLVQVKDLKYQVIVSQISFGEIRTDSLNHRFSNDVMLESLMTEKRGSKLRSNKSVVELARILNLEFSDLFDLQKSNFIADF